MSTVGGYMVHSMSTLTFSKNWFFFKGEETTKQRTTLNKHVTSLHGVRKLQKCHICDKELSVTSMKQHIEIVHGGRKPFKCNNCNISFAHKSDMNIHIESVHEGKKPLKCEICNISFA